MDLTSIPLSELLYTYDGKKVELLKLTSENSHAPTIVFIHGHNKFGAWEMLFPAYSLFKKGYSIVLPSQAGYGHSSGPADYCGPETVGGIGRALSDSTADKVILWGISRGATVAALLGEKFPHLFKLLILQSGAYDMEANYNWPTKPQEIKDNIFKETGGASPKALRERSPLFEAEKIEVPTLILHGEQDETVSPSQAKGMHQRFIDLGKEGELVLIPGGKHSISGPQLRNNYVLPFLQKHGL